MEIEKINVLKRFDVKRAAIFWSFARAEMREGSDIQVELEGEKSLLEQVAVL